MFLGRQLVIIAVLDESFPCEGAKAPKSIEAVVEGLRVTLQALDGDQAPTGGLHLKGIIAICLIGLISTLRITVAAASLWDATSRQALEEDIGVETSWTFGFPLDIDVCSVRCGFTAILIRTIITLGVAVAATRERNTFRAALIRAKAAERLRIALSRRQMLLMFHALSGWMRIVSIHGLSLDEFTIPADERYRTSSPASV